MKKHYTKSTQLNPPITELITITIATTTYLEKRKLVNFKNGVIFFLFHVVSTGDVCPKCNCCLRKFLITRYDYRPNWIPLDPITIINHKVAIYSIVIGLIKLPSSTNSLAKFSSDSLLSKKFVIEQFNKLITFKAAV